MKKASDHRREEWKVSHAERQCAGCRLAFAEGAAFFSALSRDERDGLVRRDFCTACWQQRQNGTPPAEEAGERTPAAPGPAPVPMPAYIAFWRTRLKPPEKKKHRLHFEPAIALSVFSQLQEQKGDKSEEEARLLFILALSLVRHKVLRLSGMERSGGRTLLRLHDRKDHEFVVEDPGLKEQDIAVLLDKVGQLLEMNLDADEGV